MYQMFPNIYVLVLHLLYHTWIINRLDYLEPSTFSSSTGTVGALTSTTTADVFFSEQPDEIERLAIIHHSICSAIFFCQHPARN